MTMKKLLRVGVAMLVMFAAQAAQAEPIKGLITDDYVRVRAKPNTKGDQLGFLYKNMVVELMARTPDSDTIGKDSFPWHEVKQDGLRGWVYGKFISLNAPDWNVDTYDAPGDTQWLSKRFGDNTWYYQQKMSMRSFSIDDYRNLMSAAEKGNEQAWIALRLTILLHLHGNPDDANYAYLKKRLYSAEFLKAVLRTRYNANNGEPFDLVPWSRELVLATVEDIPDIVRTMPEEYWNDKEIVRLVVSGPLGCWPQHIAKLSAQLKADPGIKKALAKCKTR